MTDITELAQSLKAAAEKATPGRIGDRIDGSGSIKYQCFGNDGSLVLQTDHKNMEYGFIGPNAEADELFFRECAPANILALVEALEKAHQRIDELENDEVRQRLANAERQLYMAELAKNNLRASRKAQFRKRKAAEQRIAELESRTVTFKLPFTPEPSAFAPWAAKAFYQFHKDTVKSCVAVFSDACAAAGIKVEAE